MGKKPTVYDFLGENAEIYDSDSHLFELQKKTAQRAIELLEGKKSMREERILDLGCGTGWTMMVLRENGFTDIVGFDFSEDMLRFAVKRGFAVVKADMRRILPFRDRSFGGMISISSINFIEEGCRTLKEVSDVYHCTANEMYRVLEHGGRAVIQYFRKTKQIESVAIQQFRMSGFDGGVVIDDRGLRKEKRFLVLDKVQRN